MVFLTPTSGNVLFHTHVLGDKLFKQEDLRARGCLQILLSVQSFRTFLRVVELWELLTLELFCSREEEGVGAEPSLSVAAAIMQILLDLHISVKPFFLPFRTENR